MHLQGCLGDFAVTKLNLQDELRIDVAVVQQPEDPSMYERMDPGTTLAIPCYLRADTLYCNQLVPKGKMAPVPIMMRLINLFVPANFTFGARTDPDCGDVQSRWGAGTSTQVDCLTFGGSITQYFKRLVFEFSCSAACACKFLPTRCLLYRHVPGLVTLTLS